MHNSALKKVLDSQHDCLPHGFENRMMEQIFLNVEKKKRVNNIIGFGVASFVSVALIVGSIYLLHVYFSFSLNINFPSLSIYKENMGSIIFFTYIAALVLVLLFADMLIRKKKQHMR